MAFKQNNNKNQGGKRRESYFDKKVKERGPNFLGGMTPYDIARDTRLIFKDIAYGNIDYMNSAQFFTDINLVYTLESNAYSNYMYHNSTYIGLQMYYDTNAGSMSVQDQHYYQNMINFHRDAAYAYSLLTTAMNDIQTLIKNQSGNILTQIVDCLVLVSQTTSQPRYKQIFNNACPYVVLTN